MYAVISFSHKNVGVALREKLHFEDSDNIALLKQLNNISGVLESILLTTCNRCEIYVYLQDIADNYKANNTEITHKENLESHTCHNLQNIEDKNLNSINYNLVKEFNIKNDNNINSNKHHIQHNKISQSLDSSKVFTISNTKDDNKQNLDYINYDIKQTRSNFVELDSSRNNNYAISICHEIIARLAQFKGVNKDILCNNAYIALQSHAVHHVFSVASSLMSVVIGETQISGQMKAAYKLSYDNNLCAKALTRLLHFAFRCAAQVRTLTDISKNPVSVASIAVNLGLEYLGNTIKNAKILVVGVGEMGLLCLKNLTKYDVKLTLCNRTKENAQELIKTHNLHNNVSLLDFNLLQTHINEYDIIFFAVAGGVIITHEVLKKMEKKRMFFDLSMPRNLSFDTIRLRDLGYDNIEVIDVDSLKSKAATHINARKDSAKMAMSIVGQFVLDFEHWLSGLGVNPVIKAMREQAKLASYKEINRAIKKGFIPEALRDNVEKLLHSTFNEFLHAPTMKIKAMADDEKADSMLEAIANIFGMQDRILLNRYKCEYDTTKH